MLALLCVLPLSRSMPANSEGKDTSVGPSGCTVKCVRRFSKSTACYPAELPFPPSTQGSREPSLFRCVDDVSVSIKGSCAGEFKCHNGRTATCKGRGGDWLRCQCGLSPPPPIATSPPPPLRPPLQPPRLLRPPSAPHRPPRLVPKNALNVSTQHCTSDMDVAMLVPALRNAGVNDADDCSSAMRFCSHHLDLGRFVRWACCRTCLEHASKQDHAANKVPAHKAPEHREHSKELLGAADHAAESRGCRGLDCLDNARS